MTMPATIDLPPDAELLSSVFEIDDPTMLAGFLDRVRNGDEKPNMEFFYRKGSQGRKLPCAYCRTSGHPNHRNGYVMIYADGARVLIGNMCGAEHFGQREFRKMVDGIKAKNDRRTLLLRRAAAIDALPDLLAGVRGLLKGDAVETYVRLQRAFRSNFPLISSMLNQAVAARNGELHYYVKVPDQEAMSDREERREKEARAAKRTYVPDRTPILRDDEKRLGAVRSGDFFRDTDGAHQTLARLYGNLERLAVDLPSLNSTPDLQAFFRRLRDELKGLESEMGRVDRLGQSLSADNLRLIADWAKRRAIPGSYSAGPNHLAHVASDHQGGTRLDIPVSLPKIDRAPLQRFAERLASAG
jgi:hypothetical protein